MTETRFFFEENIIFFTSYIFITPFLRDRKSYIDFLAMLKFDDVNHYFHEIKGVEVKKKKFKPHQLNELNYLITGYANS